MATEKSHSCWHTPPELIKVLKQEFNFDLDAAASADNAICERFITEEMDALKTPWDGRCVWINPPYGEGHSKSISEFVQRAYEQHLEQRNTVVMLIPSYLDPKYWRDYVCKSHEVRDLVGRLQFLDHGVKKMSARFSSSIVIFKHIPGACYGKSPNRFSWDWRV